MAWKNVQYQNGKFRTNEGGGGASALADLDDTDITNPVEGQILTYNGTSEKWENKERDISPFSIVDGKVCITYTT